MVWFGLVIFTLVLNAQKESNLLQQILLIIIGCSFLFDHTLETQIGVGFCLGIFLMLFNSDADEDS